MGLFEDFGTALPEDKREAFKAAIGSLDGAIKIDSRETVEKLAESNEHLKSFLDSRISKAVSARDENFMRERFPSLVEEELKKRAPKPKDPELAAALERVEKLEKAKAEAEREIFIANQRAKIAPKLGELGLDAELADMFIGADDVSTEAKLGAFTKAFAKARDGHVERVLKERFGNMPTPSGGQSNITTREAKVAQMQELAKNPANYQQVLRLQDEINRMKE